MTNEKQRLTQKRQALVKNERDKRMAELLRFSQSFKVRPIPPLSASRPLRLLTSSLSRLAPRAGPAPDPAPQLNKPIPDDLVSILAKDEDKQRQIREKSSRDAASAQARAIAHYLGMRWGGDYSRTKDPMHFEVMLSRADTIALVRKLGLR